MADKTEKRTLTTDVKNFFDNKIKGSIVEGDISRYKIPPTLPDEAIKVSPKKIPSNKIEEVNELEAAFNHAMEKAYEKNRLPTKYTLNDALGSAFDLTTILTPIREITLQKYKEEQKPENLKKRKYIEGYNDITKSILRGGPKFIQSASEFVLTPIDYLFSTEFQEKFNKLMDTKEVLGEAETLPGGIAELVAEYAVPLTAATKIAKGAKTFKQIKNLQSFMGTSKASKIAQRMSRDAFILGLAETFVQSGGKPNEDYGINYKIPFTNIEAGRINKPEPTEGLTGRELALATFRNKFKYAREGTLIGGGFPLLAKTAQLTAKFGVKPVAKFGLRGIGKGMDGIAYVGARAPASYITKPLAKLVRQTPIFLGTNVIAPLVIGAFTKQNPLKVLRQLPPFSEWRMQSKTNPNKTLAGAKSFDDFLSNLRSFNEDTLEMGLLGESLANKIKASTRRVNKGLEDLDAAYYGLASGFQKNYNKGITSPVGRNYELDRVLEYLKGQRKLDTLPKEYQFSAKDIGDNLDKLRKSLSEMLPKNERFADFKKELLDRGNKYMRASFAVFENPMYQPLVKDKANAVEYILKNVMRGNKDFRIAAKESYPNMSIDKGQRAYAEGVVDNILHTGRAEKMDPIDALRKIGTRFLRNDDYKFLKKGEDLPVAIQKLLGEGKSLRNSVLTTTAEMTGEIYTKRAFDELYNILKASGQLVDNEAMALGAGRVGFERITKIPGLGVLNSKLQGKFVSKELAASIANQGGILDKLIKASIYRHLLQFKVLTQMGKTVFSPQTQVRNVYSAGFFPFARGHIGGNASVTDSFKIVLEDIFPKGRINKKDLFNFIEKEIELGTMDENIIASELGAVLNDIKGGAINTLDKLFEAFTKKALVKNATRLYAGGDSGWKIYGRQYVKSQMSGILPTIEKALEYANHMGLKGLKKIDPLTGARRSLDDVLDLISAHEIRNVYPTYSKVPPIIQGIRKLPFGNFVAFPAEILRTGFNIMDVSMKELSSNDAAIRELGARRLMGATTSFALLGSGLQEFGKMMTGTSSEDMDAINRLAAPYQRNAQFISVGKDEKGNPEVMDFSHTNPYDMLSKPFYTTLRSLREGSRLDKGGVEKTRNAIFETMGEFFEPFFGVSMVFESFSDVLPREGITSFGVGRGGETKSGAKVYKPEDDGGKQIEKSLIHVLNTLLPNITGVRVPVGADIGASDFSFTPIKSPEAGRFLRGAFMDPDSVEPTTGRKYTAGGEIFRAFTGLNTQIIDREKVMGFKSQEFKSERSGASTLFNDVLFLESPTSETFLEGYKRADAARLRAFRKLKLAKDDLVKLGLSDFKIRQVMRDKGLGRDEINSIMNDTYRAFRPSDAKRKEALRKDFDYPFGELQDLIDLTDFMKITPEEPVIQKKDPLDLSNLTIQTPEVNSNVGVETQPLNVSSLDQAIAPSVNVASPSRNNPSFLGSNPTDIAKNMDIARRTA